MGHFRFESGHHGDRWLEPDLLLRKPAELRPFARELAGRLKRVNDVTNAGSAVRGTYEDLVRCGAQPVALASLLVLGNWSAAFAAANGLALESLEELPNNLWTTNECPLCASRVPLENLST